MRDCPNCGAELAADANFCQECGHEVVKDNVTHRDENGSQDSSNPRRRRTEAESASPDRNSQPRGNTLRTLIRALSILGILSGFVLPIAVRMENPSYSIDQLLGRGPGEVYTLLDKPAAAAAAVAAIAVIAWLYATRRDGVWTGNVPRAWALLAAGGAAFAVAPLGILGIVPATDESFIPLGLGFLTVFAGGAVLLASATREFVSALDVRWRDATAVASFLILFTMFPFTWFSTHRGGWDINRDVVSYSIRPGQEFSRSSPPEFTGLDLTIYGVGLIQVVAAVFVVILAVLVARYVRGWETASVFGRRFSTDWLNALLVFAVAGVISYAQPSGGRVELHAHYQIASYALAVAFLAYVAPGVRRWWRRRTSG